MKYVLNIAKGFKGIDGKLHYRFFFRIDSVSEHSKLHQIMLDLQKIYPEPEYKYDCTVWSNYGHTVESFEEIDWSAVLR